MIAGLLVMALLAVEPNDATEAARVLFANGDYLGAVARLEPLGATADAEAQFYWGYSLLRLHRDSEAFAHVEAVLREHPDDLRAVYLRGVLRNHLGLRGARDDFARVAQTLPNTPIGQSAADYLTKGDAPHPAAVAQAAEAPWQWVPRLSLAFNYDSNPALSPGTDLQGGAPGALAGQPFLTGSTGAPAVAAWGRFGLRYKPAEAWEWTAGISGFERFYFPAQTTAAPVPSLIASPATRGSPAAQPPAANTTGTPLQNRSDDLSEVALDLGGSWHGSDVQVRGSYRGSVSWFGYAPFAQEHALAVRALWPTPASCSGSLRMTGSGFIPLSSTYSYLGGGGATLEPGVRAQLLGDALLIEGMYVGEVYKAADYRDTALGQFYSYSFWGHGPEVYVSYAAPLQFNLSIWGGLRLRTYMNPDVDPNLQGGTPLRRQDTRITAGARVARHWPDIIEAFAQIDYLNNLSNIGSAAQNNANVQRLLVSIGVTWP